LEKIWLILLEAGSRVRIGCGWVHLIELINIVTSLIWQPVISGKQEKYARKARQARQARKGTQRRDGMGFAATILTTSTTLTISTL